MRISELTAEWISPHTVAGELDMAVDACGIRVRSNSTALLDALREYYGQLVVATRLDSPTIVVTAMESDPPRLDAELTVKQPDPGKTKIKEESLELADGRVVRKRLTGMVFAFGGETNLAIGPCLKNDNQVVNFINNRYIEWRLHRETMLFHAAGVVYGGCGLALAGFSGRGKSTLALHIMSKGADFVSNDRLMVSGSEDRLRMFGVPKLPRVNPGTLVNNPDLAEMLTPEEVATFTEMDAGALWHLEQKYDVDLERCYGVGRQLLSHRLDALVILNWRREEDRETVVAPVELRDRRDLMPAFMKSVGLFFRFNGSGVPPREDTESYMDLLESCLVLEVSGGVDFDRATEACAELAASRI